MHVTQFYQAFHIPYVWVSPYTKVTQTILDNPCTSIHHHPCVWVSLYTKVTQTVLDNVNKFSLYTGGVMITLGDPSRMDIPNSTFIP